MGERGSRKGRRQQGSKPALPVRSRQKAEGEVKGSRFQVPGSGFQVSGTGSQNSGSRTQPQSETLPPTPLIPLNTLSTPNSPRPTPHPPISPIPPPTLLPIPPPTLLPIPPLCPTPSRVLANLPLRRPQLRADVSGLSIGSLLGPSGIRCAGCPGVSAG